MCGKPPFYADDDNDVLKVVLKGEYNFNDKDWIGVSNQAKEFISTALTYDPQLTNYCSIPG
jgi:hypothetical protein